MSDPTCTVKESRGPLRLLDFMPLIFAFGFLVPVIAQGIERSGWAPPFAISPLIIALLVGGGWGLAAQIGGRWI